MCNEIHCFNREKREGRKVMKGMEEGEIRVWRMKTGKNYFPLNVNGLLY
jgi:hypothetical protein